MAVLVIGVAGCRRDPPPPLPSDDDAGDDGVADDDDAGGAFGLIHVHDDGDRTAVHGVFARDLPDTGILDGVAALGVADPGLGYWAPPATTGEMVPVAELEVPWSWLEDRFFDAGDALTVAGVPAARLDAWVDPDGFVVEEAIVYVGEGPADALEQFDPAGTWPGADSFRSRSRTTYSESTAMTCV